MVREFVCCRSTSAGDMSLLLSPMRLASLQQLCRIAIRRLLTRDKVDSLLCMPAPMRRYLQYDRQPVSACGWLADLHILWLDCGDKPQERPRPLGNSRRGLIILFDHCNEMAGDSAAIRHSLHSLVFLFLQLNAAFAQRGISRRINWIGRSNMAADCLCLYPKCSPVMNM